MALSISNLMAQQILNALRTRTAGGANAASMIIYSGALPANVDAAAGTPLVSMGLFGSPPFGAVTDAAPGAQMTDAGGGVGIAIANGTAAYFRLFAGAATPIGVFQGTVGATGGFDATINTVSIQSGATVTLSAMTVTQPE